MRVLVPRKARFVRIDLSAKNARGRTAREVFRHRLGCSEGLGELFERFLDDLERCRVEHERADDVQSQTDSSEHPPTPLSIEHKYLKATALLEMSISTMMMIVFVFCL